MKPNGSPVTGKETGRNGFLLCICNRWFVVTYLRVEIIIVDGWLHPGYQIIAWPLKTCTSTAVLFFFVKTEGNCSFPGVLCVWVCWNHKIKIFKLCYFFVCFLTTKAALCVSSSLFPPIPNPQSALPPCHFLSHSARLVCIPGSTVLSIFNYNHTVQGFQALSWRAGTILITKLISKAAETMPAQADICLATRSWVRVKIKQAAMFSHTSFVFSKIHLQSQTQSVSIAGGSKGKNTGWSKTIKQGLLCWTSV